MFPRIAGVATVTLVLGVNPAAAQFGVTMDTPGVLATAVTFTIPLNLTQLPPDLERVKVACAIIGSPGVLMLGVASGSVNPSSDSYPYKQEFWVTGGQVISTASIQVVILMDALKVPIGAPANYMCGVMGYSKSLQRWDTFSETPSAPVFMLKPAPPTIQGTFTWSAVP